MPELNQVLGSILRDVARARFTSDLYSRNIGRFYRQDGILRRFPVPRAEIDEIEMDLKFVISAVEVDPNRRESRQARDAMVFERHGDTIAVDFADALRSAIEQDDSRPSDAMPWSTLISGTRSEEQRIEVRGRLVSYLSRNRRIVIDQEGKMDSGKVSDELESILRNQLRDLLTAQSISNRQQEEIGSSVFASLDLDERVSDLADDILAGRTESDDYSVDIDVTSDVLQELPESALSKVKIRAVIRDYVWSQVEDESGEVRQVLSPE